MAVQAHARSAYRLFRQDARRPSLRFKRVHPSRPVYSVRIGLGYRALGVREGDAIIWFWVGSHADYDQLLSSLGERK
jgi:hypothetical protein